MKKIIVLEILEEVAFAPSAAAREDEKPGGKKRELKRWFQHIAGDIWGVFDHVINLAHWKVEHLLTPNRDEGALQTLNWVKPKLITSKQLKWRFYFYDFWWNKGASRWVALLLDNTWKRVYKKRIIEGGKWWEGDGFIELDDDLREKLLKSEDIDAEFLKYLKTNWRKGLGED